MKLRQKILKQKRKANESNIEGEGEETIGKNVGNSQRAIILKRDSNKVIKSLKKIEK